MSFRAIGLQHHDGLFEIGECERARGDNRHQSVRREQLAAFERRARERAHAVRRPRGYGPVPRGDRGECLGADAGGAVDLPVGQESLEPIGVRLGSEDEGEDLDRLEALGEISELRGELPCGTAGERGRLVRGFQEQQRAGQVEGRVAARERLEREFVRAL